ncbi:MAG TPA: hypothetical protein DCX27_09555 [Balneola sp.]|nr:hypothetical protein [Balneola sp.]|tara:strand:+ start:38 stop:469 length:432 start_codon:yes stop_codon:yes gene_type:complete
MHPQRLVEEDISNYFARGIPSDREGQEPVNIATHRERKANRMLARTGNQLAELAPKIGELIAKHRDIGKTKSKAAIANAAHLAFTANDVTHVNNQNTRLYKLGQHLHDDDPAKAVLMNKSVENLDKFTLDRQDAEAKYNRENG